MTKGQAYTILGVSALALVGVYFLTRPKKDEEPMATDDVCPPTFELCSNWGVSRKCYNPILVDKVTGLYPNGTNPCAIDSFADEMPSYMQNPGPDDTIIELG